jgi:hypothetical protein
MGLLLDHGTGRRGLLAAGVLSGLASGGCGRIGFDDLSGLDASALDAFAPDVAAAPVPDAGGTPLVDTGDEAGGTPLADAGDAAGGNDAQGGATCSPPCTNPHGSTSCQNGACVPSCAAGFMNCDGDVANGCETDVNTSTANCGTCGHACTTDAGTATCSGGTCGATCDLSGSWAAKFTVPVTWPASGGLMAGSGSLVFWVLLQGTQSGTSMASTMLPCGVTIPDFTSSSGGDVYGLTYPNSLFDNVPPFLPTTPATATLGSTAPGAAVSIPTVAFLTGVTMANPTTDPWPATPEAVMQVNMDKDANPGVTALYKTGGSYAYPPVDGSHRSDEAYIASRLALSFTATLSGCTAASGSVTVTHYDTHIIGCEVSGGGGNCTQAQSDTDDGDRPLFVTSSGTVSLLKIGAGAVCSDVRSAL